LAGCGGKYERIKEETANQRTVEFIPAAKATDIRYFASYSSSARGAVCFQLERDLVGPIFEADAYTVRRYRVQGFDPDLVRGPLYVAGSFGVILLKHSNIITGHETGRTIMSSTDTVETDSASDTGRIGTRRDAAPGGIVVTFGGDGKGPAATTGLNGELCIEPERLFAQFAATGSRDIGVPPLFINGRPVATEAIAGHLDAIDAGLDAAISLDGFHRDFVGSGLGIPSRQHALGHDYIKGRGVPQNEDAGVFWIRVAATSGFIPAQLDLAQFHQDGWKVEPSLEKAYLWSLLASSRSDGDQRGRAVTLRDQLRKKLTDGQAAAVQDEAQRWGPAPLRLTGSLPPVGLAPDRPVLPPLDARRARGTPRPNSLALIIGVENYRSIAAARFAESDAREFAQFATASLGIPESRIRLLVGEQATRIAIDKAVLNWLRAEAKPDSEVFVFFAGHGLGSLDGSGDAFLMPWDGDLDLLSRSAVNVRELAESLGRLGVKHVTVFLDACYSGWNRDGAQLVADARPLVIQARSAWNQPNVAVFSASAASQIASAAESARHGLFSYWLMRGLQGEADGNGDHRITNDEMALFLDQHVGPEARRIGREQTPMFEGPGEMALSQW
jgi:hypothetical protein